MQTLKYFLISPLILLLQISCSAQKFTLSSTNKKALKEFQTADAYYRSGQPLKAETHFRNAIQYDSTFAEAYFALSTILMDTKRGKEGNMFLKKGLKQNDAIFPYGYKSAADWDKKNGYYEEAVRYYNLFLEKNSNGDKEDLILVRKLRDEALLVSFMVKNPVPFSPQNAGPSINTEYMDYHPALSLDEKTMLFCRTEPPTITPTCPGRNNMWEDFYFAYRTDLNSPWDKAQNAGEPLNTGCNEGTPFISPDGRFLFFAACERPDGMGSCDIYMSRKMGNSWEKPKNIGQPVNSSAWESQPSFSSDGKTLYFVSNRGGKRDIYSSEWKSDGSWSNPVKLPATINSDKQNHFPYIHPDNQTLYFVSDGHYTVGGDDIFFAKKQADGSWGQAKNLGYPINSIMNEQALIVNAKGNLAFVSSDRHGGYGNMDIYSFELYPEARPNAVTYFKGIIRDKESQLPLEADFELIDLESGQITTASKSDKINGSFLLALPTNRNYALNISKDNYLFHSENFTLQGQHEAGQAFVKTVDLVPIKADIPIVLKNVFFETNKYALLDKSKIELDKLVDFMQKNPSVKIEIGGHTDIVGSAADNKVLSENRAKSVQQYLIQAGIEASRLRYKGYGSSQPIADNNTEAGRAENRRTEFKIVK